jgi:transposase
MVTKSVPPLRAFLGHTLYHFSLQEQDSGEGQMLRQEEWMDIWSLNQQGLSNRAIARKLGLHRNTVKKHLETEGLPRYSVVNRHSSLIPYHGMIKDWLNQDDYQATRLWELAVQQGFEGSYETVKRFVRTLKEERSRVAYLRFETHPGRQAQVDFGDFKVIGPDGREETIFCFVMVLGFSRHMYVEFIERCTMTVFLDCHKRAFGFFGGVPGESLYDNMKNVVVKRLVGRAKFNTTFLDFARHYRFKPLAAPPCAPLVQGQGGTADRLHPGTVLERLPVHLDGKGQPGHETLARHGGLRADPRHHQAEGERALCC